MSSRHSFAIAAFLGVCCLLAGIGVARMLSARRAAQHAGVRLVQVADSVKALRQLREVTTSGATGRRPTPGLTGQVTDVLAHAGIPLAAMTSLAPEAETELGRIGDTVRMRQAARLGLEPITLPQLGQFLQAWRAQHPEWTIASLQLTPLPGRQARSARTTPGPLRVYMVMECRYIDFGGAEP